MNKVQNTMAIVASAWLLLVFSVFVYAAEPVAMITDLKGGAHLVSQKTAAQLAVLTYLPVGEEIILDAGAQMVVTYFDESAEFSFKGPAHILVQQKTVKVVKGNPADMRNLDKEKSVSAAKFVRSGKLSFATVEMRSLAIKPTLLSPVNTRITTATPLFSWKSVNEAENYLLVVSEEGGQPIQKVNVTSNSWQLPMETVLKPGVNYQWSVEETLKSGEKVTSKGTFSVADAETVKWVLSKRPVADASFSEKLGYAIFLESEGFRGEAKVLWRELAALRPDDVNLKFRAR